MNKSLVESSTSHGLQYSLSVVSCFGRMLPLTTTTDTATKLLQQLLILQILQLLLKLQLALPLLLLLLLLLQVQCTWRHSRCSSSRWQHGTSSTSVLGIKLSSSVIQIAHIGDMRRRLCGDGAACSGL